MKILPFVATVLLIAFTFQRESFSQPADSASAMPSGPLKIGIKVSPPFIIDNSGTYEGMSIDFWDLINENHQFDFEYVMYEDVEALVQAVQNGEVDFSINPITVTDQRMRSMSFSQPFFITETSMARKKESRFISFFNNLISWQFFSAIGILVAVIFIFGFLVWVFERKKNPEQFGGKLKGLSQGFWWSAVTMTTVGYGDKAPQTTGGRVVGFIWMFSAIIMISGLTASIASALTVQSISEAINSVQDLQKFKVITIQGSSSDKYLQNYNIKRNTVSDVTEGLQLIIDGKEEVFVYDKPILKYYILENDWDNEIIISESGLKTDYYSFSFPKTSSMLPVINPTLVGKLKTEDWKHIVEKYQ